MTVSDDSMHEDLHQFKCTCNSPSTWDHQPSCNLWDSEEFNLGRGVWHEGTARLYSIFDTEAPASGWVEDEAPDDEAHVQSFSSLHTADEDEIGGPIGETLALMKNEPETGEDKPMGMVLASDTIYSGHLNGDSGMKAYIEEAIDQWVDKALEGPPNFSYRGCTWVWDTNKAQWEAKALKCYCGGAEHTNDGIGWECTNCMVQRSSSAGKWRQLIFLNDEVTCRCTPGMTWFCNTCKVRRKQEWQPWELDDHKTSTSGGYQSPYGAGATKWEGHGTGTWVGKCRHYGKEVVFPSGRKIWASSHHQRTPKDLEDGTPLPDFGCYFDTIWKPQCLALYIPWTDYGLPTLTWPKVMEGFEFINLLADEGKIVEIGCIGGHGRTGTAMAALALMNGVDTAEEAVEWVHTNYCKEAIEGDKQEWWLEWVQAYRDGQPLPTMPTFSAYGQKKADRSKNKGSRASVYQDSKGQLYCGACQTDCKEKPEDTARPTHCWWCEVEFKYKTAAEIQAEADAEKAKKVKPGPKVSKTASQGSQNSSKSKAGKQGGPKGEETVEEALASAYNRLWPTDRFKLFWAPESLRCNNCGDRVSWRWPAGGYKAGWVHRTKPAMSVAVCDRPKGSYK